MRYLSVCSGVSPQTKKWKKLGWEPVAFSEIEAFPSAVLKYHYPDVPNVGDMTKIKGSDYAGRVDVLIGGTPCQSFSVAGLRKGLADPRGNLALEFLRLADEIRPKWLVWENVPGVRSSTSDENESPVYGDDRTRIWEADRSRDFGSFLAALSELGFRWAYRSLDAQYSGLAQRRERVFLVASSDPGRSPEAVLFESHSLQGYPAPCREKGQVAPTLSSSGTGTSRTGNDRTEVDFLVANPLAAKDASGYRQDLDNETYVVAPALTGNPYGDHESREGLDAETENLIPVPIHDQATRHKGKNGDKNIGKGNGFGIGDPGDPMHTLGTGDRHAVAYGFSAGNTSDSYGIGLEEEVAPPLRSAESGTNQVPTVAFQESNQNGVAEYDTAGSLRADAPGHQPCGSLLRNGMAVRRLMPIECERLMGMEDNYTQIPWKGKPKEECPDGPRYRAIGNSWAVTWMVWLAERINMVEEVIGGIS